MENSLFINIYGKFVIYKHIWKKRIIYIVIFSLEFNKYKYNKYNFRLN